MDYTYEDIKAAYSKIGVSRGRVVLLKTDLRYLGRYDHSDRNEVLRAHYNAIAELVDLGIGTIVVTTNTTYLCNTDNVYDPIESKSERGVLTEFVRKQNGAIRSFHPFFSYAAIGRDASTICENVSRHSFGVETPKDRMIMLDTLVVNIGIEPRLTCPTVHHAEKVMGVPYRYTKEFIHSVMRDGKIVKEPFYHFVYYVQCNIKRNRNKKIFAKYLENGYEINQASLGRGKVYSYPVSDFFKSTVDAMKEDTFIWLDEEPTITPYRE